MNNFPSKLIYIIIFSLLILYFTVIFINNADKKYHQLNYNFNKITTISKLDKVVIDSISYDFIRLKNHIKLKLNTNDSYKLLLDKSYFFRTTNILQDDKMITFKGVNWINKIPKYSSKKGNLKIVDIPFNQKGETSIVSIGDALTYYNGAKYFRKKIASLSNVNFVGNQKDLFSYPYQFIQNSNELNNLPKATIYLFFLGYGDRNLNFNQVKLNWKNAIEKIKDTQIIIVALPKSNDNNLQNFINKYNQIISKYKSYSNVKVVESSKILDLNKHYIPDGNYPNKLGYELLAFKISKIINEFN